MNRGQSVNGAAQFLVAFFVLAELKKEGEDDGERISGEQLPGEDRGNRTCSVKCRKFGREIERHYLIYSVDSMPIFFKVVSFI